MTLAISAGLLVGAAVYLMMKRDMLRIALGFTLLSHGANLVIMSAGGTAWREEPFGQFTPDTLRDVADPIPQAFVLTSIVISFSISILMFVTAAVGEKDDATRDEVVVDPDKQREIAELVEKLETLKKGAASGSGQNAAEYQREYQQLHSDIDAARGQEGSAR